MYNINHNFLLQKFFSSPINTTKTWHKLLITEQHSRHNNLQQCPPRWFLRNPSHTLRPSPRASCTPPWQRHQVFIRVIVVEVVIVVIFSYHFYFIFLFANASLNGAPFQHTIALPPTLEVQLSSAQNVHQFICFGSFLCHTIG